VVGVHNPSLSQTKNKKQKINKKQKNKKIKNKK
jgi:hypothetical protein